MQVTKITSSDPAFSYSGITLPVDLAGREEKDFTVTFRPAFSTAYSSEVTIATDKGDFKVSLKGEGNYAPGFVELYQVANSGQDGNPDYDGFYELDASSEPLNGKPVYKKPAPKSVVAQPDYYLFYCDTGQGMYWAIDQSLDTNWPYYINLTAEAEYPPQDNWFYNSEVQSNFEFSRNPWVTGNIDLQEQGSIVTFTAHHRYTDAENNAEDTAGTVYQWYQYNVVSEAFDRLDGETASTYTTIATRDPITVKVEITVYAKEGFAEGNTAMSYSYTETLLLE